MFKSLKSKFIVSFIAMQTLFFALIISINFSSLDKSHTMLTEEKIEVSNQLLIELLKTPIITYDLATIDDIVKNFSAINSVVAVLIHDKKNTILSSYLKEHTLPDNIFDNIHNPDVLDIYKKEHPNYIFSSVKIKAEGEYLGHANFVFDATKSINAVENNKKITYLLVLLGLIVGLIISYVIGNKLGKSLNHLTKIAKDVADNKDVFIAHYDYYNDEIGELFYAMHQMQVTISGRTHKLNNSINDLQQFMNALNHSAIVSKTDTKGVITYVNSKFCEVTGYSEDELLGNTHSLIKDPDADTAFFKDMWATIKAKKIFRSTFRNVKKNGEFYYVDATIVPLLDNTGNIVEYIAIRYEVTEIMDAKDKALEAKKAKDNFLSNMSHEIRTPMNAIFGFVQILQKNITDEKNLSYLKTIQNSSQALLHIINDILDISKIESGKLSIDIFPFDPKTEILQTVEIFTILVEEKHINMITNIDEKTPDCLQGDMIRIKQIMFNLISNAIKFTDSYKNIFVNISYEAHTELLYIVVKDEGIGMSAEAQKKIFNVFEQADNSTTRKFGGTGLGLSISSKLVSLMGGNISVESTEGIGSSFTVTIPLKECAAVNETLVLYDSMTKSISKNRQYAGKILIAEDNKTNQMLIKFLLEEYGLEYTVAEDGLEAVDAFKSSRFSLVLMDESMPNMTGIEAFKQIREYEIKNNLAPTPVVPLTANVMHDYRMRFANAGMDDFLAKPIDYKELERVLEKFLK